MKTIKMFPCTQIELYTVCTQAWTYCKNNLALFTAIKPKYTEAYVAERVAEIENISRRPNQRQRLATITLMRLAMKEESDKCLLAWKRLRRHILEAWPEAEAAVYLKTAGEESYREAYNMRWEACLDLIKSADSFIKTHQETLKANNNMAEQFAAEVEALVLSYSKAYRTYLDSLGDAGIETGKKQDACNKLYKDLMAMFEDAKLIFRGDRRALRQFNFTALLSQISGTGMAGIKGVVSSGREDVAEIPGLELKLEETGIIADIEDDGSYRFSPIAAGKYTLVAKADGYITQRHEVNVNVGSFSMWNVELVKEEPKDAGDVK